MRIAGRELPQLKPMQSVLPSKVAVIGAGLAGLTCSARLRAAGVRVVVLEKSRDIGGRLATRREEFRRWNHGAPAVHVRSPEFRAQIELLRAQGTAAWLPGESVAVGVPDMRELLRPLSQSHIEYGGIEYGAEVMRLQRGPVGWSMLLPDGRSLGLFDIVVCTAPATQTCALLRASGISFPDALAHIDYAPCWALLLALPTPDIDLTVLAHTDVFGYVGRQSSAGEAAANCAWVLHATAAWSAQHLEHSAQDVQHALFAEVASAIGTKVQPVAAFAHRWRFARATQPLSSPSLWLPAARIAIGGDGFGGGDAAGAFRSALALADTALAQTRNRPA